MVIAAPVVLALLGQAAWLHANSTNNSDSTCTLLRRSFVLPAAKVTQATVAFAVAGYGEVWVNGEKADATAVLEPGVSQWNRRLHVPAYDVTSKLVAGTNTIGLMLGAGWYGHLKHSPVIKAAFLAFGQTGPIANVSTDAHWTVGQCPILYNDIYNGEIYDARVEDPRWATPAGGGGWPPAEASTAGPKLMEGAVLSFQDMPPIRAEMLLPAPTLVREEKNYTKTSAILDFGQNIAGWLRLDFFNCSAGTRVTVRHSEMLTDDRRNLYIANLLWEEVPTDHYICRGGPFVHEPHFTYHGFRFAEVIVHGEASWSWLAQRARTVHTAVNRRGKLVLENQVLMKVQSAIEWTQLDNLHSIPTDCPQRGERQGWLADSVLSAETALHNFDMKAFYRVWLQNIVDTQETGDYFGDCTQPVAGTGFGCKGALADTSPHAPGFNGNRPADPSWGVALPLLVQLLARHYGMDVVQEFVPAVHAWADFLLSVRQDGLVSYYYYGDWLQPNRSNSTELVSNMTSCFNALLALQVAADVGTLANRTRFIEERGTMHMNFITKYWNDTAGWFGDGTQAPQVLALHLGGLTAEQQTKSFQRLTESLEQNGLLTGLTSTKWLFPVLSRYGRADLGLRLASSSEYPSWGWMLAQGSTTIWEHWGRLKNGSTPDIASHNHPALTSIGTWYYTDLVGIRVDGADKMSLGTALDEYNELLPSASGSLVMEAGTAEVSWQFRPFVAVSGHCPTSTCAVRVPLDGMDFSAAAAVLAKNPVVTAVERCGRSACVSVDRGTFQLELKTQSNPSAVLPESILM